MSWVAIGGAAIGAVGSIYTQRQASKAAKGTKTQQEIERLMADNLKQTSPIGLNMLKSGQGNIDIYDQFYKKLARGDRASAMQLLAPQFSMMDRQRQGGMGAQLMLAPKGGGSAEGNLNSQDNALAARNDAILGLRTSSVDKLGAAGLGEMATGNSILGQGSGSGLGLMGAIQNTQNSAFESSRAAGQGMFQLLQMLQGGVQGYMNNRTRTQPLPAATKTFGNVSQFSPGTKQNVNWSNPNYFLGGGM